MTTKSTQGIVCQSYMHVHYKQRMLRIHTIKRPPMEYARQHTQDWTGTKVHGINTTHACLQLVSGAESLSTHVMLPTRTAGHEGYELQGLHCCQCKHLCMPCQQQLPQRPLPLSRCLSQSCWGTSRYQLVHKHTLP